MNSVVVGTGFRNPDGSSRVEAIRRWCRPGREVHLRREPGNDHDANAVAVDLEVPLLLFWKRRQQIGYLRSGTAKSVAKRMDAGQQLRASITSVWAPAGVDHPRVSLAIRLP